MVNVGIIGLGDNGMMHLRGFDRLAESRVAAVCDLNETLRERAVTMLDDETVISTDNWESICENPEINAICVSVPTYLHMPIAMKALECGKDVFLEKPISTTLADTDRVIKAAFATDRVVQVGLVYRYSNLYRTLGTMVEDGDFGDVMMAWCKEFRDNFPTQWFFETEKSGGAILDKDCHHFDLFSWFIRRRPVKVFAAGGQHVVKGEEVKINCGYAPDPNLMIKNPDIVDHAFVTITYDNGALANLALCMYQVEPKSGLEVGIIGANGAHAMAVKDVVLKAGGGPLGEIKEVPVDYYSDNFGIGHIGADRQHVEFIECIKTRTLPYANLITARESMVISMAAERSIKEGREVLISEFDDYNVTKIIEKRCMELYRRTPEPQKPEIKGKIKKVTKEKEILDTFVDLVRLIQGKRPKGEALPFSKEIFSKAIKKANEDKKYLKAAKGLNAEVSFEAPNKTAINVLITDGRGELITHLRNPAEAAHIIFTDEGWSNLQTGDSIQRLFLTRQVRVEGNIDPLKPYMEAMIILSKSLSQ